MGPGDPPDRAPAQTDETVEAARARAAEDLPCPDCGSTARPLIRKPRRMSISWWDDPSCYIGCADCARYLAEIPSVYPTILAPEVPEDLEEDPEG